MQWNIKYRLLFTKKRGNGSTATPSKPTEISTPSYKLYRNITDLPLCKFIDCAVDGNLSALVISGNVPQADLVVAWVELSEQYSEKMGDAEYKLLFKLYKEIVYLQIEYEQVITLIQVLNIADHKPFADKLNGLLFTNYAFAENKQKELSICLSLSKEITVRLDMKEAHFKTVQQKQENTDQRPTREYYQSLLITLSDYSKYQVTDAISTFEFCDRIQRYTQFVEKQKQQANGRR